MSVKMIAARRQRLGLRRKALSPKPAHTPFADAALRYDRQMRDLFGVPAISPASRLLLYMTSHDSVSIKEAMLAVPLSYRAFYTLLDVLKDKELVRVEPDANDRRVRRLVLGTAFKKIDRGLIVSTQPY
mgnify:CR=1 FL=1